MMHTPSHSFNNPVLEGKEQEHALAHKGGDNWATETFVRINYKGLPVHKIDADAYLNDLGAFWHIHERKLWLVIAFCLLFLTAKLLGS